MQDTPHQEDNALRKQTAECEISSGEIDLSLLDESLRMTPWERMKANDDALNFAESLRTAMERHHAKSQ